MAQSLIAFHIPYSLLPIRYSLFPVPVHDFPVPNFTRQRRFWRFLALRERG